MTPEQDNELKRRWEYLMKETVSLSGEITTRVQGLVNKVKDANPELFELSLENAAAKDLFWALVVASSIQDRASAEEEVAALREEFPKFNFVSTNDPNLSALEDALLAEGTLSEVDKVNVRRAVVKQMDEENR